jgi:general secretion pathway protein A
MYLDFFKLQQLPFRLTADPRFHYESAERSNAKRHLLAALGEGAPVEDEGCLLISGDAGVGKTILVQDVLGQLSKPFVIVQIRQPGISVAEFHEAIAAELGADAPAAGGSGTAANVDACIEREAALGHRVVLAVDSGEILSEELLDEILRLPGRSSAAKLNLRVVLAARSSLGRSLNKPRFAGPASRLGLHVELRPLTTDETKNYIDHRLRVAGRTGGAIFSDDAIAEIHRFTGGVPRLINTLADTALIAAFNRNHGTVTAVEIRAATQQLQWVEYDARADRRDSAVNGAGEESLGHISIEYENATAAEFDLPLGRLSLGRSQNNDVRINSRYISRNHCRVLTTAQFSVIEDLQSQNGITVGSLRVSVHRLQHGEKVMIGDHTLTYTRSPLSGPRKTGTFPLCVKSASALSDNGQTGLIASGPGPGNRPAQ